MNLFCFGETRYNNGLTFSGRTSEGEGREPEFQHLRNRERARKTLGRNGTGSETALPASKWNRFAPKTLLYVLFGQGSVS
jgi:hypothetical protein